MSLMQESPTVTVETHPNISGRLSAETDRSKADRVLTTVFDESTRLVLATVSQKENARTRVDFLKAKGGFFAIVNTEALTYLALPGSQIQLPDTLLNLPGDPLEGREIPAERPDIQEPVQEVTDQAMILGAGLASRFLPISGDLTGYAKPSVPLVGNDSVIVTLARHLQLHGIRKILVNTFYMPDILKAQLNAIEGLEFIYIDEDKPSGTAGGLLKALESGLADRSKPILIMQGDAVTDANLSVLLKTHEQKSSLATIGVKHISDDEVSSMAIVVTDRSGEDGESGFVQSFKEKPTLAEAGPSRLASIGFYVLSPQVYEDFLAFGRQKWEATGEFDYAFDFFPGLLTKHPDPIYARMIPQPFYWSDIGRPDQYVMTVRDIHAGKLNIKLPENMSDFMADGIIYWEDARQKAVAENAALKGNIIVFNRRS